jgi:uncharacterized repeat protein (TIGR03803 family)
MSIRSWSGSSVLRSLVLLCSISTTGSLFAQNVITLYSFSGGADGSQPPAGLVRDAAGNLYGTTAAGGSGCIHSSAGCGTVFKVDTSNHESVLYNFTNGKDGGRPLAGLIRDAAGNLYGTTALGGDFGAGTVFMIDTSNQETVILPFPGRGEPAFPQAGVIMDAAGNFYGTTGGGGSGNSGTVWKYTPSMRLLTLLHSFTGGNDGKTPQGGLIMDAAGNLYGTAAFGGPGGGTVFKIDTASNFSVLYGFTGNGDGGNPHGDLVMDAEGNLYGTTAFGGSSGRGTVYKIDTSNNQETVLYSFQGGSDGANPLAGLLMDGAGNLFGTTSQGGNDCLSVCGTIFMIDTFNHESVLYSFTGGSDGGNPTASLVMDAKGNLYGTTSQGGAAGGCARLGCGTVFEFPFDDNAKYAMLNGHNTFNGNQTVNGLVSATNFMGNGSSLTNINPANIAMGTANISILGNAATATSAMTATLANSALDATNADNLGGVPAASFARLDIGNAFTGNQSVSGNDTIAGSVSIGNGTAITQHLSALFNPSFPALSKGTCATASFPYNGVNDGDTTALGVPNARAAGPGNFVYTAWASAANTITIQGCNVSGTNQTTAGSGSIRVDVWKH